MSTPSHNTSAIVRDIERVSPALVEAAARSRGARIGSPRRYFEEGVAIELFLKPPPGRPTGSAPRGTAIHPGDGPLNR